MYDEETTTNAKLTANIDERESKILSLEAGVPITCVVNST